MCLSANKDMAKWVKKKFCCSRTWCNFSAFDKKKNPCIRLWTALSAIQFSGFNHKQLFFNFKAEDNGSTKDRLDTYLTRNFMNCFHYISAEWLHSFKLCCCLCNYNFHKRERKNSLPKTKKKKKQFSKAINTTLTNNNNM